MSIINKLKETHLEGQESNEIHGLFRYSDENILNEQPESPKLSKKLKPQLPPIMQPKSTKILKFMKCPTYLG